MPDTMEQISVSREEMGRASALFDLMQAAREDPNIMRACAGQLSYSQHKPRVYPSLEAARQLRRAVGDEGVVALLGGHAARDWMQFAQQPAVSDVHVNGPLTMMSVAYRNDEYIGPTLIPRVQVTKRSDLYFIYDKANLRRTAKVRAPGGPSVRSGYTPSTDNYSVKTYSQEHVVPDEVRTNADTPLDADRDGVNFATDILDLEYEIQAAALIETSANWTTNATLAGATQWSDYTGSDPLANLATARPVILKQSSKRANTFQMSFEVFEKLALHPDLIDRCKYTGTGTSPAMVTAAMIAQLAMVANVAVGGAIKNSGDEGASDSIGFVWGKHAWLGHVEPAPALARPSAAYVFSTGRAVDRYREENIKSDVIRVEEAWDMKKVDAGSGYRFVDAIA